MTREERYVEEVAKLVYPNGWNDYSHPRVTERLQWQVWARRQARLIIALLKPEGAPASLSQEKAPRRG